MVFFLCCNKKSIPRNIIWSSFILHTVLHFVLANSCPAKPKLLWQGDGLVGGWRAIHRYCPLCLFNYIVAFLYLFRMGILYLFFFACLVLRYPEVEVNPGPRVVAPRCCRVIFSNINMSSCLSVWHCRLSWNEGYPEAACGLVASSRLLCSHPFVEGFSFGVVYTPLAWLSRDSPGTSVTGRCEVVMVAKVAGSRMNFYSFIVFRSPAIMIGSLIVSLVPWVAFSLRIPSLPFVLSETLTVTIVIGWDPIGLIPMALLPWILPLWRIELRLFGILPIGLVVF